jgi:hypothetical protein
MAGPWPEEPVEGMEYPLGMVPILEQVCGRGRGLAVCPSLGILVVPEVDRNALSVYALPRPSLVAQLAARTWGALMLPRDSYGYGLHWVRCGGTRSRPGLRSPP